MPAASLDPLIGRDALLVDVAEVVGRQRLVTLTGPGGTGKTRLAEAVAAGSVPGRHATLVDVSTLMQADDFATVVASALRLPDDGDPAHALASWAATDRRLLVLDNLEQARDVARPIEALLQVAPTIHVLATSRMPLGATDEYEIHVPPLALPTGTSADAVEASAAGALFLRRARAIGRLRGSLDVPTAAAIADLCKRLDGLPLAIELAAARTRILPPARIADRLATLDHAVLGGGQRGTASPSLAAVLDWSLTLLDDEERDVLSAVSVAVGGFDIGLASALAGVNDAASHVETLVAHGLVQVEDPAEGQEEEPRFRLLETIRMVALGRLGDAEVVIRERHAGAMLALARRWEPQIETRDIRRALARLDADRENLVAAITWAIGHAPATAIGLVTGALTYWIVRGSLAESMAWTHLLLPSTPAGSLARAELLAAYVRLGGVAGLEAETAPFAREVIASGRALGRPDIEAEGLYAELIRAAGDPPAPASADRDTLVERVHALASTGIRAEAIALDLRIVDARARGGIGAASELLDDGFEAAVAEGMLRRACHLGEILAWERLCEGHAGRARAVAERTVQLAEEMGDPRFEAFALQVLAIADAMSGSWRAVAETMSRSVASTTAVSSPRAITDLLQSAAIVAAIQDRGAETSWLLGAAAGAFAPAVAPAMDDEGAMTRIVQLAQRRMDPVVWERERRAGAQASRERALARVASLAAMAADRPASPPTRIRPGRLTAREVEVLTLVGHGRSDREIAAALGISAKTASVHVANVKGKLGASNRLELALKARDLGLVS